MIQIYHNPRCSKSRQALDFLKSKDIDVQIILYLEKVLSRQELKTLLKKLNISPSDIIRKKEAEYKEMGLNDSVVEDGDIIDAIIKAPTLLERPIIVNDDKAVIGRPLENILKIL